MSFRVFNRMDDRKDGTLSNDESDYSRKGVEDPGGVMWILGDFEVGGMDLGIHSWSVSVETISY